MRLAGKTAIVTCNAKIQLVRKKREMFTDVPVKLGLLTASIVVEEEFGEDPCHWRGGPRLKGYLEENHGWKAYLEA